MTVLPRPMRERWQPLRLGVVDMFHYDVQEFAFHDGRLLVRGNNGTGKSKLLSLTLPFLLDASLAPHRVEPDGDPQKRMAWNLLLDGKHEERLGYSWIEFGRRADGDDEDGDAADDEAEFLTIGCGMKAVAGRGIHDHWYFLTTARVGRDLFLVDQNSTALTRDRLADALAGHDDSHLTRVAVDHRAAVDERLFQLGPERYGTLMDLLVQLRQPQLSKQPKEELLSAALTRALAPLDHGLLADVANALHELETMREELAGLQDAHRSVNRFLATYRRYARAVTRRLATGVRETNSAYEHAGRQLGDARAQIEQHETARGAAASTREAIDDERAELEGVVAELGRDSALADIGRAETDAAAAGEVAAAAQRRVDEAAAELREHTERLEQARSAIDRSRANLAQVGERAAHLADEIGASDQHSGAVAAPISQIEDVPVEQRPQHLATARSVLEMLVAQRSEAIVHMRGVVEAVETREHALEQARRERGDREGVRDAALEDEATASLALEDEVARLVVAWREHAAAHPDLDVPEPDDVALADWARSLVGPNPADAALMAVAEAARRVLAHRGAEATARIGELDAKLAPLEAEVAELRDGALVEPSAVRTRMEGAREGRAGAAIWEVVDFAVGVEPRQQAALEAALEASGLLDAWITPDGELLDADTGDVLVRPAEPVARSLATCLRPALELAPDGVDVPSEPVIAAVLAAIGHGEAAGADTWINDEGRWQTGRLRGRWSKPAPQFVGETARCVARESRIREIDDDIDAIVEGQARARADVEAVTDGLAAVDRVLETAPGDQAVRDAHAQLGAAGRQRLAAELRLEQQQILCVDREHDLGGAQQTCAETAADLRLPQSRGALDDVHEGVHGYRAVALEVCTTAERHLEHLSTNAHCTQLVDRWNARHTVAVREAADADRQARRAAAQLSVLGDTLGAAAEEIARRLAATRMRMRVLDETRREAQAAHDRHLEAFGVASGRELELRERIELNSDSRRAAIERWERSIDAGLLDVALPELAVDQPSRPWAPDPAVRFARRVEQDLQGGVAADDETVKRVTDEVHAGWRELADALTRYGHHADLESVGEAIVVTVQYRGRRLAPHALTEVLAEEAEDRERLLDARQRALIEEHLVSDVATHLQELIADAEQQLVALNAELAERPTSTGMRLRLRWNARPDGPDGFGEARRRLLRQDTDLWSAEDRAAVGDFLHGLIRAEREASEHGTWHEQLGRALDYRSWHSFAIERFQDGRWRSATGPASGGERVLAVSLPLFAAASSHYRSAHPNAPRLVLLDEAFAGVDDDARASCLGLLASFDLDVVMTSEREWGFYSTVPGIATHELARRDGIDAVHVTSWEWDGEQARRIDPVVSARAQTATAVSGASEPGAATRDSALW